MIFFDDNDKPVGNSCDLEQKESMEATTMTCQQELARTKELLQSIAADFQNFQRRTATEQTLWTENAQRQLLLGLLAIVDDFDRALAQHEKTKTENAWAEGIVFISKSLYKYLQTYGVTPIIQTHTFDPMLHEAIEQRHVDGKQTGDIVEIAQKGFMFKDRILRPAQVVVAK